MEFAAAAPMHAFAPNPFIEPPSLSDAALAAQYDNNSAARNADDLAALRALSADAFAHRIGHATHRFSAGEDGWVDVFLPPGAPGPVPAMVFVHGGRWRLNTSRETAFWAEACVQQGMAWVGINFAALGQARLPAIVAQVEAAIATVVTHARALDIDPAALSLAGHSSGAHLALSAALSGQSWVDRMRALLLLGGMYDLRPLARSMVPVALGFTPEEAVACSPLLTLEALAEAAQRPTLPPVLVAVGGEESPEFIRQAQALHWRLHNLGVDSRLLRIEGRAHFDAALEFNAADSRLRAFVARGIAPAQSAA